MPVAGPPLLFLLGFVLSISMLGTAFYLEHGMGLAPCALCLIQRCCMGVFALVCLAGFTHRPNVVGRRRYAVAALASSSVGALSAGRQVWLQNLPNERLPGCVMPLDRMLDNVPILDVIKAIFDGSADCLQVNWSLYGMSAPEWSLLAFAGFILLSCLQIFRRG
jgi:disulfide bond formation protein DsbB